MQDYEEYFSMDVMEGKTEGQIVKSLGSPKQLSKELLADYFITKGEETSSTRNVFQAIWAVIGLSFVNLLLVLGPFLGLVALLLAGWVTGLAGIVSPLLVFSSAIVNTGTFEWFDVFFSMILCGVGLFISVGIYYGTVNIKRGFLRYLKFNLSIVKGGNQYD
ncbi:DUF1700 domain-containing protein [Solibacillus sp. FSL R5-0449]|uniref:HAAS domain-containing protein n=1 Tax=Solibacillus sp. FSL R5-0449 TaxID=2921639 RepID=UPI0030D083A6